MTNELSIDRFIKYNLPYFNAFLIKDNNGEWKYSKKYLNYSLIEDALLGKKELSYFGSTYTRHLSVDIDDHLSQIPWNGEHPSIIIQNKYNHVVNKLNVLPSIVIKTPRGIHCTWYFEEMSPSETVNRVSRNILRGIDVEIKPTMYTGIRIPILSNALNPSSLSPIIINLEDTKIYKRIEIFDVRYEETIREKKRARKAAGINVGDAEKNIIETLSNGSTNEQLCTMAGIYRHNAVPIEEAINRFKMLLNRVSYNGDLLFRNNLERRMKSLYNGDFIEKKNISHNNYDELLNAICDIAKINNYSTRQIKSIRNISEKILLYSDKQKLIYEDKSARASYNERYSYFIYNMRNEFTPIPSKMLISANKRYHIYLPFLKQCGFLTQSNKNYSVDFYCKSYYIERDKSNLHKYCDSVCEVDMIDFYNNFLMERK